VGGDLCRIKELFVAESFDQVVCNPPYGSIGSGRQNPGDEEAVARHEIRCDVAGVVQAVAFCLSNRGRASFVYPAGRAAGLIFSLRQYRLEPKRLQIVYSYPGGKGRLILLEVMKNGGEELTIEQPFYVYQRQNGDYSLEMQKMYEKNV
jgi:tRNA1(Val) A37 N6-methylase TrmN6